LRNTRRHLDLPDVAAEPQMEARKQLGLQVSCFLILFAGLMYFSKKKSGRRPLIASFAVEKKPRKRGFFVSSVIPGWCASTRRISGFRARSFSLAPGIRECECVLPSADRIASIVLRKVGGSMGTIISFKRPDGKDASGYLATPPRAMHQESS